MTPTPIYLVDVIRCVGGWPVDLAAVALLLAKADELLAHDGGRACTRPLTDAELDALGVQRRG